jgi:hypothetical protein
MVGGVYKFKVEFLKKVKMSEPNQSENTKSADVSFGTSTLEGMVATLADGSWSVTKTFNTMDEAKAYLESFFGSATEATVTYDENGGSGSVDAVETYVGAIIMVSDGTGITPPAGKVFLGWDTSSTATIPDITGSYKVTGDVTLYAVYGDE